MDLGLILNFILNGGMKTNHWIAIFIFYGRVKTISKYSGVNSLALSKGRGCWVL